MEKVLITGAGGGLGSVLSQYLKYRFDVISLDFSSLDVTNRSAVEEAVRQIQPQTIIHCAAIVNADQAQRDKSRTYAVNVKGTEYIAKACKRHHANCVFFSSDYVFNGTGSEPYEVDSLIDPINYYGVTKVLGEQIVRDFVPQHYIIRISWLFGPHGNTFLHKILARVQEESVTVVDDQIGSPTYTLHLSKAIDELIQTNAWGTYHITNEGFCSWADYAQEILRLTGSSAQVIRTDSSRYFTLAKRPLNSRLSKDKAYAAGVGRLPSWQDALAEYFHRSSQTG